MKSKSKLFVAAMLVVVSIVGACKFSSTETADLAKDSVNTADTTTLVKPDSALVDSSAAE